MNEDEDLSSEHTVIDQPSYIDRERHSAGNVGSRSGSTPTNSDSKQSVDVRSPKSCSDGHDGFASNADASIGRVK